MHLGGMRRLALLILYIIVTIACHLRPSSPAATAASGGDVAAMKRMLDAGLDPNARDAAGYTPLIAAARAGNAAMIRLLHQPRRRSESARRGRNSWTPLLHAVHKAQPRAIAALLDAGANPNGADPHGHTPLMMAAGYGYTDIVKILLAHKPNPACRRATASPPSIWPAPASPTSTASPSSTARTTR